MTTTSTLGTHKIHPLHQRLVDHLVLRTPRDERDITRCAEFVSANMRETSGITAERVLHHFPNMRLDNYFFVEDEQTGKVVSNLCLLPWKFRLGHGDHAVTLDVAMLEIVATHPDYRKRGLIRTQINAFHELVAAQNFDFSIIEGIPYYYRQFGYAYATDHAAGDALAAGRVPDALPGAAPLHLRPATDDDIPHLVRFYDATMAPLDFVTHRNEAMWRYVLNAAEHPMYMLEAGEDHHGADSRIVGYVCAWRQPNGDIRIAESGIPAAGHALALLQLCKQATRGEIKVRWPQENTLMQVARSLGSVVVPSDQWLIRINDVQKFLMKLAPVFAARLAHSPHAGLTSDLTINFFRQAYRMRFVEGQLVAVDALGFVDASMGAEGGDLCIPPDAFTRWVMGYRALAGLADAWPDIVVRPARRHLLETLFPLCRSHFYMPYFYFGMMERIW